MLEGQFLRYFKMAERKRGITGENLLQLLERRLDNVVYRLGFAVSRAEARQMVLHGHFQVNGKRVNVPSYQLRAGDEVAVREGSREHPAIASLAQDLGKRAVPEWLQLNAESLSGRVLELPKREQIDTPIQEHLIVELYSR
jgi:small subunit ribosomal protein S4